MKLTFLEQGAPGQAVAVAGEVAEFIAQARSTLHMAVYDLRLAQPALAQPVVAALRERAAAGVEVRIAYDAGKPAPLEATPHEQHAAFMAQGADPAPTGTAAFIATLGSGVQAQAIRAPLQLMHHKYIVRDGHTPAATLLMGSANFTDDSWTLQENNLVEVASPQLCAYYETDFDELWHSGSIDGTGVHDAGSVDLPGMRIAVDFSPGDGQQIAGHIAGMIAGALRRIKLASMILTSGPILGALADALENGQVADYSGVYDRTQMEGVMRQWEMQGGLEAKIGLFRQVSTPLAGKRSTPYAPDSPHDFMHNKVVVCDDVVLTGSFNFSSNATRNAENVLKIYSPEIAEQYCAYIDRLSHRYGET